MVNSKRKILHFITGLETGGAEMMLLKTLPSLHDDFDNSVCCIRGHGPIGKKLEELGIPVYYLDLKSIFDFGIIIRFKNLIQTLKPDLLVTYLIHADLFGRIFGRIFGIKKIICSVRVKLIQPKYLPLLFLDAVTSHLVTHYHFNSNTVADMYRRYFFLPKKKYTVIPNGLEIEKYQIEIDTNKKKSSLGLPENSIVIGSVGRLEKQKGHTYLLHAFAQVIQKYPSSVLVLVGDGSEHQKLKKLAQKLKIDQSVHFVGKRSDVPEILKILDIFVLPSIYEGMSNALMEAMISQLPIITTNIPENIEVGKDGCLYVAPKDCWGLAQTASVLLGDPKKQAILAQKAQKIALESFSLTTLAQKFKLLFQGVIS